MIEKGEIRIWKHTPGWLNNPDRGKVVLVLDIKEQRGPYSGNVSTWVTFLQEGKVFTHEKGSFERLTYSLSCPENINQDDYNKNRGGTK